MLGIYQGFEGFQLEIIGYTDVSVIGTVRSYMFDKTEVHSSNGSDCSLVYNGFICSVQRPMSHGISVLQFYILCFLLIDSPC